ncbi:MAG: winged helix-turn-helix domain-containing protein [Hyphomicrobiales bacterium]
MDLQFGPYLLKRRERQLAGPAGPLELSVAAFDILCELLDHAGAVISKNSLLETVWPNAIVEENTLQVHVSALRKALEPGMIETVHGRGYKYAGPEPETVRTITIRETPASDAIPRKPTIFVLPFENQGGDPDQQYFSDGITEDITDRLTRFRAFAIIGQHAALAFRGKAPDFAIIRERLKADFVVTGSVRRLGDRIRIAVRLADARSETAMWAERYDRPLAQIFELQDEVADLIAASVANQLEIEIAAWSGTRIPASFAAYEHILKGNWHFKILTMAATARAITCFEQALALDPRNAEAMSLLAMCYTSGWMYEFSDAKLAKGIGLARDAIAFDESAAKAHAVLGLGLVYAEGLETGLPPIERALALNPKDWFGLSNRSMVSIYEGKPEEARALSEEARRLNRMPPFWLTEFECISRFGEGHFTEVLPGVEPMTDGAWDMMYAMACYGHLGMRDKARETVRRFRDQGREIDFMMGAAREPYVRAETRDLLADGLKAALR